MLGKTPPSTCSTLLDHVKVSASGLGSIFRSLSFPAASHLPKVLILQSASARAGADRTFSDQYLGQVRAGEQMKAEGREPGTAASGLLVVLFAGRSWRMVRVCRRTLIM